MKINRNFTLILILVLILTLLMSYTVSAGERRTEVNTIDNEILSHTQEDRHIHVIAHTQDGSYVVAPDNPAEILLRKDEGETSFDVCSYDISSYPFNRWDDWEMISRDLLQVNGDYGRMIVNFATGEIEMPLVFRFCEILSVVFDGRNAIVVYPDGKQSFKLSSSMTWKIIAVDVTWRKNACCEPYCTMALVVGEDEEGKSLMRFKLQSECDRVITPEILSENLDSYTFVPGEEKGTGNIKWSSKSNKKRAWILVDWRDELDKKDRIDAENLGDK